MLKHYQKKFFQIISNPWTYLILLYVLFVFLGILNTFSFLHQGERFYVLTDDSMISMRYARNLANGNGLVWNPKGEAVEGFSNLLWTLYMTFWHATGLPESKVSLAIHSTGIFFLILTLHKLKRIAETFQSRPDPITVYGSLFLTGSFLPFLFWSVAGMSHVVLSYIVLCCAEEMIRYEQSKKDRPFRSPKLCLLLGAGLLLRVDFFYLFFVITIFLVLSFPEIRGKLMRDFLVTFFIVMGIQTGFRYFYFGDVLPNTYYLKLANVPLLLRFKSGLYSLWSFLQDINPLLFSATIIYGIYHWERKIHQFTLVLIGGQFFYNIYVGGDGWDFLTGLLNRFIVVIIPLFFLLMVRLCRYMLDSLSWRFEINLFFKRTAIVVLFLSLSINMNWAFMDEYNYKNTQLSSTHNAKIGLTIKEITRSSARVAVVMAGSIPYFSERPSIDQLGYVDNRIARQAPNVHQWKQYRPGHVKFDYEYSLIKKKPDVIVRTPGSPPPGVQSHLTNYFRIHSILGSKILLRNGSREILWKELSS